MDQEGGDNTASDANDSDMDEGVLTPGIVLSPGILDNESEADPFVQLGEVDDTDEEADKEGRQKFQEGIDGRIDGQCVTYHDTPQKNPPGMQCVFMTCCAVVTTPKRLSVNSKTSTSRRV